jgi:cephalosporin-C deacetylase-like acetyl esterase
MPAVSADLSRPHPPPLPREMLAAHLLRVFETLDEANRARRRLTETHERWPAERERLLAAYHQMLGAFPERTPLNARTTGRIERERYVIEKVIFESQPRLLVTANLYVPHGLGNGRAAPAVLVPCGHSENGKAAETYQRVCTGLASKGYVVLIYDPIGQGERQLYWNAERGASDLGGNTTQHSYAGNQCLLLGTNIAQVMVWDSLRALDYLASRPEVDAERIGMAGNSGGGTNTAYTALLDERIKATAICCYITTLVWRRRVWSTGDGEQNLLGQLATGLDHADMLRLIAPRPALTGSGRLCFFPLEGARESVAEARPLFEVLGNPEGIAHAVADAPHGYTVDLRRATYRWMNRWLLNEGADDAEPDLSLESDADLQVTEKGQVALLGSEDVFALNRKRLALPAPARTLSIAQAARALTGFESPAERPVARPATTQLFRFAGVQRVETFTLWPESDVAMPGTVYSWRASAQKRRAVLWLDGEGMEMASERQAFKQLLAQLPAMDWLLATVDVRGTGETAPRESGRPNRLVMGAEAFLTYETFVAGKPLFGMRVRDAACAVEHLLQRPDVDEAAGVALVGWGAGGLWALHLAALDEQVSRVCTIQTLESFRSLVEHARYSHSVSSMIPGVVRGPDSPNGYDLDELTAEISPRPVLRLRPVNHLNQPMDAADDAEIAIQTARFLA